jgi:hypothetical protein
MQSGVCRATSWFHWPWLWLFPFRQRPHAAGLPAPADPELPRLVSLPPSRCASSCCLSPGQARSRPWGTSSCGGGLVGLGSATPEQARTAAAHRPIQCPLARAERMPPLGRLRQQGRSHLAAAYAPPFRAAAAHLDLHQAPRLARMALPGAAHWGSS